MPSVCFYFQVHQPFRLKRNSIFNVLDGEELFDEERNREIMLKVARKCYLPTNDLMLRLIDRYKGAFKISYSISGVALEQMELYSPETLESFIALSETGCVEFIGETYFHSLSALFNEQEFFKQVSMHRDLVQRLFGQTPQVFRDTELIYNNRVGELVASQGYKGVIAEGVDDILDWRSPNFLYKVPGTETRLLLKNYRLSDDIAFRFSNRSWDGYPLTADKFAEWAHRISGNGDTLNLFMDYETFGEHQWADSGIFNFLEHLPEAILRHPDWNFRTPSEVIASYPAVADLSFHRTTSWADLERDITAWHGNRMQASAIKTIYELEQQVFDSKNDAIIDTWRRLQTSDHFYYMCTKWFADGDVHAYFSPYESPYDAFIYYMNALRGFREVLAMANNATGNDIPRSSEDCEESLPVEPVNQPTQLGH